MGSLYFFMVFSDFILNFKTFIFLDTLKKKNHSFVVKGAGTLEYLNIGTFFGKRFFLFLIHIL